MSATTAPVPAAAPPEPAAELPVSVNGAYSVGRLSSRRLMAYAGAAPEGLDDPVLAVLRREAEQEGLRAPTVLEDDVDPARADRRFGLVRLRRVRLPGTDDHQDIVVMRGDLESMLKVVPASREQKSILRKNAAYARVKGARPFGVATARVLPDGSTAPFALEGFVSVRPTKPGDTASAGSHPDEWVRVNVWSATLRVLHWLNVLAIVVLSTTGFYIMDPFVGPQNHAGVPTGYLMGWMRAIHFFAAFLWIAVGLIRVALLFVSRNRYLRWSALWPFHSKEDVRNLFRILAEYTFIRRHGPLYLAHNPLQQVTYTSVYIGCALQMVTGMTLYGLYHPTNWFWRLWAQPAMWLGIPTIRIIHTIVMLLLWAFVIAHIYLAVRADSVERHGGVSSMINGGVWLRRGSKPVDGPKV